MKKASFRGLFREAGKVTPEEPAYIKKGVDKVDRIILEIMSLKK